MLLKSIARNTLQPEQVIIIDNSLIPTPFNFDGQLTCALIRPLEMLGVNASWNMGAELCEDCDAVSILNDDVVLRDDFFEKNARLFQEHEDCGVACPGTIHDLSLLSVAASKRTIVRMRKREGWAFTIRRTLLDQIPPIPEELRTFCGDDWFWTWTHKKEFYWYKDTSNIVYHKVGASVRPLGLNARIKQEKAVFLKLIKNT